MILSKTQYDEMLETAKPLMKWLADNFHPHCSARVDDSSCELVEGIATVRTTEFIRD